VKKKNIKNKIKMEWEKINDHKDGIRANWRRRGRARGLNPPLLKRANSHVARTYRK